MIEINGNPNRRDLSEHHAKLAAEAGVMIVCNTDAHGVDTLANMRYSVATARRAWLSAEQVANTRPWRSFAPLRKRRRRRARTAPGVAAADARPAARSRLSPGVRTSVTGSAPSPGST